MLKQRFFTDDMVEAGQIGCRHMTEHFDGIKTTGAGMGRIAPWIIEAFGRAVKSNGCGGP